MDETAGTGEPAPGPGWLDDPFHRRGQRWWDGQQWTAHARSSSGEASGHQRRPDRLSQPTGPDPSPARVTRSATGSVRRTFPWLRTEGLVIVGVLLAFAVVGLVAPGAEESGALSDGYPRAAYWACADLLTQRLGPSSELEFPGDSTATITQDGPTWTVRGRVAIVSERPVAPRTWVCTVTYDEGVWRGTAALD